MSHRDTITIEQKLITLNKWSSGKLTLTQVLISSSKPHLTFYLYPNFFKYCPLKYCPLEYCPLKYCPLKYCPLKYCPPDKNFQTSKEGDYLW